MVVGCPSSPPCARPPLHFIAVGVHTTHTLIFISFHNTTFLCEMGLFLLLCEVYTTFSERKSIWSDSGSIGKSFKALARMPLSANVHKLPAPDSHISPC